MQRAPPRPPGCPGDAAAQADRPLAVFGACSVKSPGPGRTFPVIPPLVPAVPRRKRPGPDELVQLRRPRPRFTCAPGPSTGETGSPPDIIVICSPLACGDYRPGRPAEQDIVPDFLHNNFTTVVPGSRPPGWAGLRCASRRQPGQQNPGTIPVAAVPPSATAGQRAARAVSNLAR
jgi:hypothetical protein